MRIYTIDDIVLFCSEDMAREYEKDKDIGEFDPKLHIDGCLENFLEKNPKIGELAKLHSELNGLKGIAILSAHGNYDYTYYDKKKWVYFDEHKPFSIQRWINKQDGAFGILVLYSCNPKHLEIYSKRSAVVSFNNIYSGLRQEYCGGQVEIYIPKLGYVDSYVIDYEIIEMKKKIEQLKKET